MSTTLPAAQAAVLEAASPEEYRSLSAVASSAELSPDRAKQAAYELQEAGMVSVSEETSDHVKLTEEGTTYHEVGLPEVRLYRAAKEAGAVEEATDLGAILSDIELEGDAVDIALANFARKEYGSIDDGEIVVDPTAEPSTDAEAAALEAIATGDTIDIEPAVLDQLERRGLIVTESQTERSVRVTEEGVTALMGGIDIADAVGRVTPELLASGEWRDVEFASYNVEAEAATRPHGKEHILRQTANRVKDVLVGMGFKEMEGPHVDAQFWINDCLFMPQDHPARTHWDQFALAQPEQIQELPSDLVKRVKEAHLEGVGEDGDGYHSPWTEETARRLDLRGHTTSLSMRFLSGYQSGELDPPERYFSVEKVYRNDTLDPTHLLEFFQIEGWVMADGLSARDLMGTFAEFYDQFGITDLEFKPHYNPYTEPSFELFGTHPNTGELVEVGNSGIFRDEVTEPLGVDADVMAWGLSLERLLMLMYGFEDIRDVHGTLCDLELLRETEVVH